jgi:RsiW-degrading membrane proteinase PrsW (M82 family)
MIFIYFLYISFGILPSLAWLFYYLKKDLHPESKKMILKIFLWGSLATIPVYLVQKILTTLLNSISLSPIFISLIYGFLIIAFTEELFKYLIVKFKVLKSPECDEPVDIMIYMIVSALGFAAVENIFYIISSAINLPLNDAVFASVIISLSRFLGATFLHTLCSALVGYFLILSIIKTKNSLKYIILGILIASLLHGLFNLSIMKMELNWLIIIIPIMILVSLSIFIISKFEKIKKMKSICI